MTRSTGALCKEIPVIQRFGWISVNAQTQKTTETVTQGRGAHTAPTKDQMEIPCRLCGPCVSTAATDSV